MVSLTIQAGTEQRHLVLRHHISQSRQMHRLELPFDSLLTPCNVAFGASSKYVLALASSANHAAFVDVATAAVRLQPRPVPGADAHFGIVCGSAGYAAVSSANDAWASISVLLTAAA